MSDLPNWFTELKWSEAKLLPAIVQDHADGAVLMLAWMNPEALAETLRTGKAVFYSRSRGRLWRKGETSGHWQIVKSLRVDCDHDTLLLQVEQIGGIACHTGRRSCFSWQEAGHGGLEAVEPVLKSPDDIYGKGE